MELSPAARFEVAALVDRIVDEQSDTVSPSDARRLLELIPPVRFYYDFGAIRWQRRGGTARGYAAGIGNVRIQEREQRAGSMSFSSSMCRAGQWKLLRIREPWIGALLHLRPRRHELLIAQVADNGPFERQVSILYASDKTPVSTWAAAHSEWTIRLPGNGVVRFVGSKLVPFKPIGAEGTEPQAAIPA